MSRFVPGRGSIIVVQLTCSGNLTMFWASRDARIIACRPTGGVSEAVWGVEHSYTLFLSLWVFSLTHSLSLPHSLSLSLSLSLAQQEAFRKRSSSGGEEPSSAAYADPSSLTQGGGPKRITHFLFALPQAPSRHQSHTSRIPTGGISEAVFERRGGAARTPEGGGGKPSTLNSKL